MAIEGGGEWGRMEERKTRERENGEDWKGGWMEGRRGKRQSVASKGRGTLGVRKGRKLSESQISRIRFGPAVSPAGSGWKPDLP